MPRRCLAAFRDAKALRAGDGDLELLLDLVLAAGGAGGVVVAVAVHCGRGARRGDNKGIDKREIKKSRVRLRGRKWEEEEMSGRKRSVKEEWAEVVRRKSKADISREQGGKEMKDGRFISMGSE